MDSAKRDVLLQYSACDIADALLKLQVPYAGFLPDLSLYPPPRSAAPSFQSKIVAPASTILLVPKDDDDNSDNVSPRAVQRRSALGESNIPPGAHWADIVRSGTVIVIAQPEGQYCAALGGILATRLAKRGALAAIVRGRVRDMGELNALQESEGFFIWAKGHSVVGSGAEAKPWAVDVEVDFDGRLVRKDDVVFVDSDEEAVVVIPRDSLDKVLEILPGVTEADARVLKDVQGGGGVREAFRKHRG